MLVKARAGRGDSEVNKWNTWNILAAVNKCNVKGSSTTQFLFCLLSFKRIMRYILKK